MVIAAAYGRVDQRDVRVEFNCGGSGGGDDPLSCECAHSYPIARGAFRASPSPQALQNPTFSIQNRTSLEQNSNISIKKLKFQSKIKNLTKLLVTMFRPQRPT